MTHIDPVESEADYRVWRGRPSCGSRYDNEETPQIELDAFVGRDGAIRPFVEGVDRASVTVRLAASPAGQQIGKVFRDLARAIVPRIERTRTGAWLVKGAGGTRRYSKRWLAAQACLWRWVDVADLLGPPDEVPPVDPRWAAKTFDEVFAELRQAIATIPPADPVPTALIGLGRSGL